MDFGVVTAILVSAGAGAGGKNSIPDRFAYFISGLWCSTVEIRCSTQSQTGRKAGTENHGF